jgi:hypothetical protein
LKEPGRNFFWRVTGILFVGLTLLMGISTAIGRSKPTLQCMLRMNNEIIAIDPDSETIVAITPRLRLSWIGDSLDSKIKLYNKQSTSPNGPLNSILFLASDGSTAHEIRGLRLAFGGNTLWSPDGKYIAIAATDILGTLDANMFIIASTDGSTYRTLAINLSAVSHIIWSYDSAYVVVIYEQGMITVRNADLNVTTVLDRRPSYGPLWSPIGHKLAFTADPPNETLVIYDVDRGREDDIQIPPMEGSWVNFDWSPDSKYLIAARFTNAYSASWSVYRIEDNKPPTEMTLVDLPIYPTDDHHWIDDGHTLLWIGENGTLATFDVETGQHSVLIEDSVHQILAMTQHLIVVKRLQDSQLLISIDLNTGRTQTLANNVMSAWSVSQSANVWAVVKTAEKLSVIMVDEDTLNVQSVIGDLPTQRAQVLENVDSPKVSILLNNARRGFALYDPASESLQRYPLTTSNADEFIGSRISPDQRFVAIMIVRNGLSNLVVVDTLRNSVTPPQISTSAVEIRWAADSSKVLLMGYDGAVELVRTDGTIIFNQIGDNSNAAEWLPCTFLTGTVPSK